MKVKHTNYCINFNVCFAYSKDDLEIKVRQNIQIFNLMTSQLFIFYEDFQCLIINEDLNLKFRVNKFKTLMFKATNND